MADNLILLIALVLYTIVVSLVGYLNRRNRNMEDFFLASRSLPSWLLAITFIASWWGGGSAIDLVDISFVDGLSTFWIYGVPVLLATFLMFFIAPKIRKLSTLSQPELFEKMYDSRSALMLSLFILIFMTLGAAVQIIVMSNFLHALLNLSYLWSALLATTFVLFYSMFGGFRGVVLTDLLQFVFFLISSIMIFYLIYHQSGGIESLQLRVKEIEHTGYLDVNYNLKDKLAYVITFGLSWMIQANVWQRISAARTPRSAKSMMAISFIVFIPLYLIVTLTGMFSSLIYDKVPTGGVVSHFLLALENPLLKGFIFIGLCSAIMSTMDSLFNTGALTLTIDIYKKYFKPHKSELHYVSIARLSTFVIAAVALVIALKIKSVLTVSWIGSDFITTGAFVPLVLGFFLKKRSAKAAFVSMVFGLIFSLYNFMVALGVDLPVAWRIASTEQAIIGILVSLVIFVSVSLVATVDNKKIGKRG